LRYLVKAAFENRSVKEIEIAIDAFGTKPDFDEKVDGSVRAAARHLRRALDTYYASEGSSERIRLRLPEGGYRITFEHAPQAAHRRRRNIRSSVRTRRSSAQNNNAPGLPENFVNRSSLYKLLIDSLLAEEPDQTTSITALQGMAGIGKTALALALCNDVAVQKAFPDGIYWFAIGNELQLDFVSRVKGVPALDKLLGEYEGEVACISQYRSVLRTKAVLVVLDDVWRASDVELFRVASRRSRLVITTRNASIGSAFGAREVTVPLLSSNESRQVLGRWSGWKVDLLPPQANDLIEECAGLSLTLAIIGTHLRGKVPAHLWDVVLDHFRKADLATINAPFPEPHSSPFRAIQVSVDALDPTDRERYLALAVLLESMAAAPAIQQTLWGVTEAEALETSERLVHFSLAQREAENGAIRLHDLQLDYIRALHPDREALDLIHGAIRLSAPVINRDPRQFASQMVGRLLPHRNLSTIDQFITAVTRGAPQPWLCPLHPSLDTVGISLFPPIVGHHSGVSAVAVSADGQRAVSASLDETLKVWDIGTGRELRTLTGHEGCLYGVCLSSDGRIAVSAAQDRTLKVWDAENGHVTGTLEGHAFPVGAVALSPDGRYVISGSWDATLKMWDLETGQVTRTFEGHKKSVNGVAVSADWRIVASASEDATLKVWDVATGTALLTLTGHAEDVWGVAMSADERFIVSASEDTTLKVWNLPTGKLIRTLKAHSGPVYAVAVSADGRRAVSASEDHTLKLWDLERGSLIRTLQGHCSAVFGVTFLPGDREAISASDDTTLKVWDLGSGIVLRTMEGWCRALNGLAVNTNGDLAVLASSDKSTKVWDLNSRREIRALTGHTSFVYDVALSPDGCHAVSASGDGTLKVWDLRTNREPRTLAGHTSAVWSVAVSGDGKLAISASEDRTLRVWDLATGREIRKWKAHAKPVYAVALSADGRRAVSCSADLGMFVWDVKTGSKLLALDGHPEPINGLAMSPDARFALSASDDWTIKMWDLEAGRLLRTFEGHSDAVNRVALCSNGKWAVSASWDKTLKVWDLATGAEMATFTCDVATLCCGFVSVGNVIGGDHLGRVHLLSLKLNEDHQ
jgi:WD40 repeat protein